MPRRSLPAMLRQVAERVPLADLDARVYIGRGGSGKSTLARHHLEKVPRLLLFDTMHEDANAAACNFVVYTMPALVNVLRHIGRGPGRICWRGNLEHGYGAYELGNAAAWAARDMWLHWEEVDVYIGPHRLPPNAYRIANMGRHRGLKLIACARRPARVSRDLTANASRLVMFSTTEPADVAYLRDLAGADAAAALAGLAPREAVDWTPTGWSVKKSLFA